MRLPHPKSKNLNHRTSRYWDAYFFFYAGLFLLALGGFCCQTPYAQNTPPSADSFTRFPIKSLRLIVPYTPGGNGDIVARLIAQPLSKQLGQNFVIDNHGGVGGNIGAELAARAPADGYHLMLGTNTHAINMSLYQKLGYDLEQDFLAISSVSSAPLVLIIHPTLPVNHLKDLIALAKAHPQTLNYASGGSGSSAHVITELFCSMARIHLTHVPYKGIAQATTDLIAGQVQMSFNSTATALSHIKNKRVRGLAISTATRSALAPGLPTVAEAGLPGFEASIWQGLFFPNHTPEAIVNRLNREINKALSSPEIRQQFKAQGVDSNASSTEAFSQFVHFEINKWHSVIKKAGATLE
jgi:tripartite-type tricarboxylate transporter receptor subunit TctC